MTLHRILVILLCLLLSQCQAARATYLAHDALCKHLADLATAHHDLVHLESLTQSAGQRTVWLVRITAPSDLPVEERPAMLVVAGIEGNDQFGTHVAVTWVDSLIAQFGSDPNVADLLKCHTVYVIPRLNADATERFFDTTLRSETSTSDTPIDDDHDSQADEDGPDDLNQDGQVTWMRVQDKQGQLILDAQDERLLLEADALKGEVGQWRYLPEGLDNDQDEQWNEDGPGGVNFNRNFPFNYSFYAPDSGAHQLSEPETRVLADFVIQHPQIGLVVTYGAADNLLDTPKSEAPPKRGLPMTAIDKADIDLYEVLGERYRQALDLEKTLTGKAKPGTFSDWMYYHRGRLSLAISPWHADLAVAMFPVEKPDEPNEPGEPNETGPAKDTKKDTDKRNEKERAHLAWLDQHDPNAFVPWQAVDHPDFPDQRVEIGGYAPYALSNPPAHLIEDLTERQTRFLTECAGLLPRIEVRDIKVKPLGESLFDVEIQIENTGFLPTSLAQGQRTREVYPTRLILDVPGTALITGLKIQALAPMSGSGAMSKGHWILHCPDRTEINFSVVSMLGGRLQGTVTLTR
ncbi:MAG: hypothetical protein GY809_05350 [Planctomycetes bacterium]|nr:hypothetical protein [Planctomycetota bacterium]